MTRQTNLATATAATARDDDWVSINDACLLVGKSRRTIYHWIARGILTTRRTAGGTQQILAGSLFQDPVAPIAPIATIAPSLDTSLAPAPIRHGLPLDPYDDDVDDDGDFDQDPE